MIPFNKPHISGKELDYISQAMKDRRISGDGFFSKKCHEFFEHRYSFKKTLLTTSCTDALEMAAILLDIKNGDEVIAPSYTFVSTVNAFTLRGAAIIFADSCSDNPNIDPNKIEALVTNKTKAIVIVHYAGIACDMHKIMEISRKYSIPIVEDAAQAVDSFYQDQPLGSIGTFGTFSFHETKNVVCGEGGLIAINDSSYIKRAEIIREKGTNRSSFFRGEVNKYGWVDIGSSFLPSELVAAFLYAQLEKIDDIQRKRKKIWDRYYRNFNDMGLSEFFRLPQIPTYATNNAHMFYIVTKNASIRAGLIKYLKENNVHCVFHYLSLHKSDFYKGGYNGESLINSDHYTDCLLRFPMYYDLSTNEVDYISQLVAVFFEKEYR